jgi:hypothetical protein
MTVTMIENQWTHDQRQRWLPWVHKRTFVVGKTMLEGALEDYIRYEGCGLA